MSDERINARVEEILASGRSPEAVCGGDPELLAAVRSRLAAVRAVEGDLDVYFPSPLAARLEEGSVELPSIPGYDVQSVLGRGGMGVVFRARQRALNRPVALKMMLADVYASPSEVQRFVREAEALSQVRHPNIVAVHDAGESAGRPYFAMELVEGGTLAQELGGQPRPIRAAVELAARLARAVNAAHEAGIIHCDLKPANVLLDAGGTPKVADFGLARRIVLAESHTGSGRVLGTPSYMAPEQVRGSTKDVGTAVDVYALGAILYEMLTGRPPFRSESPVATQMQVLERDPVPPSQLNAKVPRDVETICLKCLRKEPDGRYASAAELADDLERFVGGLPIRARPIGATERALKWCRRRPSVALAIAVTALAISAAAAGGIWLYQEEQARRTDAIVRRESARASIETALPSVLELVKSKRWVEARGMLGTARVHLADADSSEITERLATMEEDLEVAEELERIYQSFLGVDIAGYTYAPAREAYSRMLRRIGLGRDVGIEVAAARARQSLIREELLVALDLAACAENVDGDHAERDRLLAIGRVASPDPLQDRFRDPDVWGDVEQIRRLFEAAQLAEQSLPSHQVFLICHRLSKEMSTQGTRSVVEALREAQLAAPSDPWLNLTLAEALRLGGDLEGALQFYRTTTALQPENVVAWCALGWALKHTGDPVGAMAPLQKAIALRPEYPLGLQFSLDALATGDRWGDALAGVHQFTTAYPEIELPAETKRQILGYARSAAANRQWTDSAGLYAQAHEEHVPDAHLLFEHAAVSLLAGQDAGYRDACASMLERRERAGLRRFLVARTCTLATVSDLELERASEIGMPELDHHADRHWSLTARAALLCRAERHGEAIATLERSLQSSARPEHGLITWAWLSRAYLGLEKRDAAKMWHRKVVELLDQHETKPTGIHLHDWLEAEILRQECEARLAL